MADKAPKPHEILRSKDYGSLLVISAIFGIPVAIFSYFFLYIIDEIQKYVYTTLPGHFGSSTLQTWWPVVPLLISGIIVGWATTRLPGKGGEVPINGLHTGGKPLKSKFLWSIGIAAVASIGLGAVVGPEAPLIALGGGLAYAMLKLVKSNAPEQAGSLISASGSFASVSTLLGSPLTGAFLLMEAAGLGGLMMEVALLPGLLAAGVGYLIFIGLDSLTGLGTFSLTIPNLPYYHSPTIGQIIWAIIIGILAPILVFIIRKVAVTVNAQIKRPGIITTAILGLIIALLAISFSLITNQSHAYILFSGQNQLSVLLTNAGSLSIGALILIIIFKGIAYSLSLIGFRGGPTFPAMFLGAVIGVLLSHIFGLTLVAGVAIGIGAMTASMLRLPLTAVLLTTIFLGSDGVKLMPITILAAVIAYVGTQRIAGKMPLTSQDSPS